MKLPKGTNNLCNWYVMLGRIYTQVWCSFYSSGSVSIYVD